MILVIDCGSEYFEDIINVLNSIGVENKKCLMENIELEDDVKGIIISGGPMLVTEEKEKHLEKFGFLKTIAVPVLGICLGHQWIGVEFGSEIYKYERIKGKNEIEIIKYDELLKGLNTKEMFEENHCEWIELPNGFELLAKSENCDNEVMRCCDKKIWGVQFHPEISGEVGKMLIKNFCQICEEDE